MTTRMRTPYAALGAALCLGSILAACGGGGGSPIPSPTSAPVTTATPSPTPTPTATPSTQTSTISVSAAATTAPMPSVAGYSGTLQLPASTAASGTTIAATSTTVAPGGLPTLSLRRSFTTTTQTVYLYESITPSATITFNGIPGFTLTLPSSVSTSGQTFYIALLAPGTTQWQMAADGPAQLTGQTLTFPQIPGTPVTLNANQTYWFAFYSVPTSSVTPTPSPTPAPTATPSPTPTPSATPATLHVDSTALAFGATGPANMQTFAVTGGTAPYDVSTFDPSVVTVKADSSAAGTFDVTPQAAGTTTIHVTDANGQSADISVTVTTLSGVIQ